MILGLFVISDGLIELVIFDDDVLDCGEIFIVILFMVCFEEC